VFRAVLTFGIWSTMASSALAGWRMQQPTGRMTDRVFKFATLVAVAVMAISPIARADPVHMACSGEMLLPNRKVDTNTVLSLTIDLRAGTVTVGGYQPVAILPAIPASPESGILDTGKNEVSFIGPTIQGVLSGSVDRITGVANITFHLHTPRERFFSGICRPAQKLF
jgi:hypothetical protein